jgi:thiol:disulfide interchange protein
MGASLGAALSLPAWQGLAVFAALGLGMALPYALISAVPALGRALPRPGPWMLRFKQFMAFPKERIDQAIRALADTFLNRLYLPVDLLLHLLLDPFVLCFSIFDVAETDSELSLQLIYPVAVLLLALVVPFLAAPQVLLDFFVLINLGIKKD